MSERLTKLLAEAAGEQVDEIARLTAQVEALQGEVAEWKARDAAADERLAQYRSALLAAEAEVERLNAAVLALQAGRQGAENRVGVLEGALKAAADALDELTDWQNGPPLVTWEEGWTAAMKQALDAIARARSALGGGEGEN